MGTDSVDREKANLYKSDSSPGEECVPPFASSVTLLL